MNTYNLMIFSSVMLLEDFRDQMEISLTFLKIRPLRLCSALLNQNPTNICLKIQLPHPLMTLLHVEILRGQSPQIYKIEFSFHKSLLTNNL